VFAALLVVLPSLFIVELLFDDMVLLFIVEVLFKVPLLLFVEFMSVPLLLIGIDVVEFMSVPLLLETLLLFITVELFDTVMTSRGDELLVELFEVGRVAFDNESLLLAGVVLFMVTTGTNCGNEGAAVVMFKLARAF